MVGWFGVLFSSFLSVVVRFLYLSLFLSAHVVSLVCVFHADADTDFVDMDYMLGTNILTKLSLKLVGVGTKRRPIVQCVLTSLCSFQHTQSKQ